MDLMKKLMRLGLMFSLASLLVVTSGCRARRQGNAASGLRVANAVSASQFLQSVPAELRDAAQKAINATALIEIGQARCTGTVVSRTHVITANHCFATSNHERFTQQTAEIKVGGSYYHGEIVSYDRDFVKPSQVITIETQNRISDFVVLKTSSPIINVAPIAIADAKFVIKKMITSTTPATNFDTGWVIGFGVTSQESEFDGQQRMKEIEFTGEVERPGDKMISIYVKGSLSQRSGAEGVTCPGDSGGPTFILVKNQPVLIGVTQGHSPFGGPCDSRPFYDATDVRLVKPEVLKPLMGVASFVTTDGVGLPSAGAAGGAGSAQSPEDRFNDLFGGSTSPTSPGSSGSGDVNEGIINPFGASSNTPQSPIDNVGSQPCNAKNTSGCNSIGRPLVCGAAKIDHVNEWAYRSATKCFQCDDPCNCSPMDNSHPDLAGEGLNVLCWERN